jgi:hypothetical protein
MKSLGDAVSCKNFQTREFHVGSNVSLMVDFLAHVLELLLCDIDSFHRFWNFYKVIKDESVFSVFLRMIP